MRGPKHVVTKGATPVLTPAEARKLLEHIDTGTLAGLRDRALFSVMLYSFARVSAVLGMRRQDYFQAGEPGVAQAPREGREEARRPGPPPGGGGPRRVRRGGRARGAEGSAVPERGAGGAPADGQGAAAAGRPGDDQAAAAAAGLPPSTCCHTFRATGITAYLSNGGTLEHAQQIAGHASPKTTKLYDRTADTVTVDEIEADFT